MKGRILVSKSFILGFVAVPIVLLELIVGGGR